MAIQASIVLSLAILGAASSRTDDPPVGTYTSPSGEWKLEVSRPEKDWNGANELVLRHHEVEVWCARHELGLRFALVSDDGRCAGFGYTGEAEPKPSGTTDGPYGRVLRVFVFDPAGRAVLDQSHRREAMTSLRDKLEYPRARGAFLVPELGRFVLRVEDGRARAAEEWWAFDLVRGAELFREQPRQRLGLPNELGPVLDARAVPGTPLVLLQWQRVQMRERSFEVTDVYHLVRPDWTLAWSREFVNEKPRKLGQDFLSTGGRGTELGAGRFEVHAPGGAGTFAFDVRRDGAGWSVSEAAR